MTIITPQQLEQIRENQRTRQCVAFEDPLWFSLLYLRHHFTHPFAPFHLEMFHLIQRDEYKFIVIMAFRESGKSTIMNTANALWSILGKSQKKFVIIMSKTQEQAKSHFANIKAELEENELLRQDFGPFVEQNDDLKKLSLELVYHGSKIMVVTSEQSIRGLKYGSHRPDLIICDDLEDTSSISSDTLYERFEREVIPMGSDGTKIIILGNLLYEDSFMMQLKNDIEENRIMGTFRAYPFADNNDEILWPQKFSDAGVALLNKLSSATWAREYMLDLSGQKYFNKTLLKRNATKNGKDEIVEKSRLKTNELYKLYQSLWITKPQLPLIKQMNKFSISAPIIESIMTEPELDDPRYKKYQEFKVEKEKLNKEFCEEYHKWCRIELLKKYGASRERINSLISQEKLTTADVDWEEDDFDEQNFGLSQQRNLDLAEIASAKQRQKDLEEKRLKRIVEVGFYDPELEIKDQRLKEEYRHKLTKEYNQKYKELLKNHLSELKNK